jgi:hypothetical protein
MGPNRPQEESPAHARPRSINGCRVRTGREDRTDRLQNPGSNLPALNQNTAKGGRL